MEPLEKEALVLADVFGLCTGRQAQGPVGICLAVEKGRREEGCTRGADFGYAVAGVDVLCRGRTPLALGDDVQQVLHTLRQRADREERAGVINHYLRSGDIDRAYAAWLSSLSEEELKDVKRVYDGGFKHPVRGLRFDWTVKPADGLAYRLFPRNTASMDQTLQLEFQDFAGGVSNLSQILRLRPGRYRLSGEVRFEGFASPTGLVFRLYCLNGGEARSLDETSPLPQSTQWIDFEKTIQVPAADCNSQLLQLESKAKLSNEQITRGMVAVDALNIDKLQPLAQ